MAANFEQETLPANLAPEITEPFTTGQHDRATIRLPRITQPRSENVNKSLPNSKHIVPAEPTTSTLGPEPGREPLPPEVNGRLAPPVTKGAPHTRVPPPNPPSGSTPAAEARAGLQHDHDYYRQPTATSDHDYFARPPSDFTTQHSGRPSRTTSLPKRYQDYDMN